MRRLALAVGLVAVAACSNPYDTTPKVSPAIDVFGPYRGVEADRFAASLEEFTQQTGIEVRYTGSADFVADLRQRAIASLSAPDLAVVPQPGVIRALVDGGALVPLADETVATLVQNYGDTDGQRRLYGDEYVAPYRSTAKSLVWYRPSVFEAHGWKVPATLDELVALVDQIEATSGEDGAAPIAPWCFSMAAGSATGWAATDWVEDLLIRQAGADAYDEWALGERAFDDPAVRTALTTFNDLVLATGRTVGGLQRILEVDVVQASEPLFGAQPGCALYKQASFAVSWFPSGVEVGDDVDFFVLPGTEAGAPAPVVAGGDGVVQLTDSPDVDRLVQFLLSPDGGRAWAEAGGYYSARTSVDYAEYYTETDRRFAEVLRDAPVTRFDASDVMPPEIGADLFWDEITKLIAGSTTLDEFVATMDAARTEDRD